MLKATLTDEDVMDTAVILIGGKDISCSVDSVAGVADSSCERQL